MLPPAVIQKLKKIQLLGNIGGRRYKYRNLSRDKTFHVSIFLFPDKKPKSYNMTVTLGLRYVSITFFITPLQLKRTSMSDWVLEGFLPWPKIRPELPSLDK